MNEQTDVILSDTTGSDKIWIYADSLPLSDRDFSVVQNTEQDSVSGKVSALKEIYGESVKMRTESRLYPTGVTHTGTVLSGVDIGVIIFVITAWLLLINRYASEMGKIIKGVLYPSLIKQVHETTGIHMRSCLRLTFAFTFLLIYAILFYMARAGFLRVQLVDLNVYVYSFAVLAVFFGARYLLSSFITKMVAEKAFKKMPFYNNIYLSALCYLLAPLVAALYMSYGGSVFSMVLLAVIASLLAGYYIFVFRIFYFEKLPFNQFFMYLCTVEIIPLAFALYLIFWE